MASGGDSAADRTKRPVAAAPPDTTHDGSPSGSASPPSSGSSGSEWPGWIVILVPFLILVTLLLLRVTFVPKFFGDEIEHAHISWSLSQEVLPYRDIHQIHMPMVWILTEPLFDVFPASADSLMVLRVLCCLAIVGTCWAAWLALDEILESPKPIHRATLLLSILAMAGYLHFCRFRPDPFMSMAVAWSLLAALRIRHDPWRHAFLTGAALGIAASFSTKMITICMIVPLMALLEVGRTRSWKPLLIGIPNLGGFVVAVIPVLIWPVYHDIVAEMIEWTVVHNSEMVTFNARNLRYLLRADGALSIFMTLAVFGGLCLWIGARRRGASPWSPASGVLIAFALAWAVRGIEPNHQDYNLMTIAMPGSLLIAIGVGTLARIPSRPVAVVAVVAAISAISWHSLVTEGLRFKTVGQWVRRDVLQAMIDVSREPDDTCVGFAPFHPVFCRDATELYLGWDYFFLVQKWITPEGKQVYRGMWPRAATAIPKTAPVLVVDARFLQRAGSHRLIPTDDFERLEAFLERRYEPVDFGRNRIWVRRDRIARVDIRE